MSGHVYDKPIPTRVFLGEAVGQPIADPKAYAERLFWRHPKNFLQERAESLLAAFTADKDIESINILLRACAERNIKIERLPKGVCWVVSSNSGKLLSIKSRENQIGE